MTLEWFDTRFIQLMDTDVDDTAEVDEAQIRHITEVMARTGWVRDPSQPCPVSGYGMSFIRPVDYVTGFPVESLEPERDEAPNLGRDLRRVLGAKNWELTVRG